MKKTFEIPELNVQRFDFPNVITNDMSIIQEDDFTKDVEIW